MVEKQYSEAAVEQAMKVQEVIDHASDGEADYVVGGGRDSGYPRADDAALASAAETGWTF